MKSNVPVFRQLSWASVIVQFLLIGLIIYIFYVLDFWEPFFLGALTYAFLAIVLRNLIPKKHKQGMRLVLRQRFAEAIPFFEKSVDYFTQHSWVDKYRFLTFLNSSKMAYREMGLCNIAFCHSQLGNVQKAKAFYERVRKEYPDNGLAIAALNLINSLEQQNKKL
ncbi:MAG: tetratricopeptide repeat protein [Saprospiraceae bacterium]|nr:tetratricopeptide repeat protein [Saprospiraceae bacterium]